MLVVGEIFSCQFAANKACVHLQLWFKLKAFLFVVAPPSCSCHGIQIVKFRAQKFPYEQMTLPVKKPHVSCFEQRGRETKMGWFSGWLDQKGPRFLSQLTLNEQVMGIFLFLIFVWVTQECGCIPNIVESETEPVGFRSQWHSLTWQHYSARYASLNGVYANIGNRHWMR